jgi:hypothetical protein
MESICWMLLDAAGHRRSPATMPGYHQGHHVTRASSIRLTRRRSRRSSRSCARLVTGPKAITSAR